MGLVRSLNFNLFSHFLKFIRNLLNLYFRNFINVELLQNFVIPPKRYTAFGSLCVIVEIYDNK